MYKVFIQDRPIFFISNAEMNNFEGIFITQNTANQMQALVLDLVDKTPPDVYVFITGEDPALGIETFFSNYDQVEAAGGIVRRKDKYLFIKRNGRWDIPKGKMERGENPRETAQREIEEECGIVGPEVGPLILVTYHTYDYKGKPTIKKTYWYELTYDGPRKGTPQLEEGITKVSWKNADKIDKVLENTFVSIMDVISAYFTTPTAIPEPQEE
jgi:8-oxo-dGTP pyrophosphatase MutT (NUDIX family)